MTPLRGEEPRYTGRKIGPDATRGPGIIGKLLILQNPVNAGSSVMLVEEVK